MNWLPAVLSQGIEQLQDALVLLSDNGSGDSGRAGGASASAGSALGWFWLSLLIGLAVVAWQLAGLASQLLGRAALPDSATAGRSAADAVAAATADAALPPVDQAAAAKGRARARCMTAAWGVLLALFAAQMLDGSMAEFQWIYLEVCLCRAMK